MQKEINKILEEFDKEIHPLLDIHADDDIYVLDKEFYRYVGWITDEENNTNRNTETLIKWQKHHREKTKSFLEQSLKQIAREAVESVVPEEKDEETDELLALNEVYQDIQELKYINGELVNKEERARMNKIQDKIKKIMKNI